MTKSIRDFQIEVPRARLDHHWKAAYGLELIRINREADKLQEVSGEFIQPYYPTEEEFLEARRAFKRGYYRDEGNYNKLLTVRCASVMRRG